MSDDERSPGPKQTSGPSVPIEGPQPQRPFNAGAFPGRDAPGAAEDHDAAKNPFAQVHRSPFGDSEDGADPRSSFAPTTSLPTGGGALRSIGEKFSPNPFTGTGSTSVPVATSPGRSGFGPSLALSYGSGQGNGPFGLGWTLGVPAISRKTEKGLPEYKDAHPDPKKRDTFILSGVEDLVPVGSALRDGFVVDRYMPRVEGGFARIERWRSEVGGEVFWKTISPDNVTSYFGRTAGARIADPREPRRVFSWLLEESHDDRGNIIVYEYEQENLVGVDPGAPEEKPRLAQTSVQAQRYLGRIRYGNATPFVAGGWKFEVVLDYGEYGTWHGEQLEVDPTPDRPWPARLDTFSTYRPGFEVRTRRLCRRVLMFHYFAELGGGPYLVASTDLHYDEDAAMTRMTGVTQRSYRRDEVTGYYESAALPTLELTYSDAALDPVLHEITDATTLENLPAGIDGRMTRLVDLDGEGVPGLVTEAAGTWYYKRGLGDGRFGPLMALPSRPTTLGAPGVSLMDVDGDGRKELVSFVAPTPGFVARTADEGWGRFRRFSTIPNIDWQDPGVQLIDLSGDGFPDVLVDRGDAFVWYRSKGAEGFEPPRRIPNTHAALKRPTLVFHDARTSIQFADMTGDGLQDLVRIRNGEVAYWPCLGFGRFGSMIRMRGLVPFSSASSFDPGRIRLGDVDGSGTVDLIYLDDRGATIYRNRSGNSFAGGERLTQFPGLRSTDWAEVVDLKGNGTGCLVWSTSHAAGRGGVLRYLELTGGQKPHLLVATQNNMGAETRVRYAPSTKFYLRDKAGGKPWATKLPFPVHVVERVEHIDHVTRQRHVQHFAYHHGYYDGQEREFRGFGLVESWDTESFDDFAQDGLFSFEQFDIVEEKLHQPPVYTKSWFHTGACVGRRKFSKLFADEYFDGDDAAWVLPDAVLPTGLQGSDAREAVRALAGRTLRTEVYALDGTSLEQMPYSLSEATFEVRQLRPRGDDEHGVYLAHEREALTYHYERNVDDPRVGHSLVLEVDDYGTVLRSAAVAYPRRTPAHAEQTQLHVTLIEVEVAHLDANADSLRLAVPLESRSYELCGLASPIDAAFSWTELRNAADSANAITYDGQLSGGVDKRLLGRTRMRYLADDLSGPLPHGSVEPKALAYDSDAMAMTETQRQAVFGTLTGAPTDGELESEGRYVLDEGAWWVRTGHPTYDPSRFFAITAVEDPFGNVYSTTYDDHALLVVSTTDPLGNATTVEHDYRVLGPWQVTDPNGNRGQVAFDVLGFVERSAVMGKVGDDDGDTLDDPTTVFEYDLFAWQTAGKPNWAKSRMRETHQDPDTRWLEQRAYFSGAGAAVMVKAQARPGLAPQRDEDGQLVLDQGEVVLADTGPNLRWVGNGRVVRDNKGNVVKAYEPYYSSTPEYEDEAELVEQGVTAVNHYDPLGRLVRTDFPNGTFSRVEFSPWERVSFDVNDTVLDSDWYAQRVDYQGQDVGLLKEKRAAQLTAKHADTPTLVYLDTLGRAFLTVVHNRGLAQQDEFYETRSVLDIQGNVLEVIDARGNSAETRTYGMLGQSLFVGSVDAGDRWHLCDALGQPMRSWDNRDQRFSYTYDALRRPVDRTVSVSGDPEKLLGRVVHGELLDTPEVTNHRGRVYRVYDGAGVATTEAFDFEGHATIERRQLVVDEKAQPDWSLLLDRNTIPEMATAAAPLLDSETFSASNQRDALGRVLTAISPDDSEVHYTYDEGGGLRRVELKHRGGNTVETVVGEITYNARGQRERVVRGPTTTTYTYDPQTYRLARLSTIRNSDNAALQGLHYHYDPAGNVTDIRDAAQQTVYFQNSVVEAANSYEYDALGRLIEATGREHVTQGATQRTHEQLPVGPQPMTSDPSAMRRYTQRYTYDGVGNILRMEHEPASGTGWTRRYEYADDGNRLLATSAPGDAANGPYSHAYTHDAHGNMTTMPHLAAMDWNHDDQLQHATAGTQEVYFQYAAGIRSRKYTEHSGTTTEERIYLGPFEIYRKRVNGALDLERESLHISDGSGRVCIVETKTVDGGMSPESPTPIWRYQLSNHLDSATTEVDRSGAIISHEEYHPYGTSAYRAADASVDVSARRYRYTGMERDEETNLGYHSARYYAPWLGRWTATDPIGIQDDLNRYQYPQQPTIATDTNGRSKFRVVSETRPTEPGATPRGQWVKQAGSGDPIYEETEDGSDIVLVGRDPTIWHWSADLDDNPTFLDQKEQQYEDQKESRRQEVRDRVDTQQSREMSVLDFTTYGSVHDAQENLVNEVDAILLGDTDLAARQAGWAAANTIFSIADVVSFGLTTTARSAARHVVLKAEARQGTRVVASKGASPPTKTSGVDAATDGSKAGSSAVENSAPKSVTKADPHSLRTTENTVGRVGKTAQQHIDEIAKSMARDGWIGQPVYVVEIDANAARAAGLPSTAEGRYVVDGHHRRRAAIKAGIEVECEIISFEAAQKRFGWKSLRQLFEAWAELL